MQIPWETLVGILFVLIFTSLKVVIFDLAGINFDSQSSRVSRALRVNLGYATYEGFADKTAGVNSWLGFVLCSNLFCLVLMPVF